MQLGASARKTGAKLRHANGHFSALNGHLRIVKTKYNLAVLGALRWQHLLNKSLTVDLIPCKEGNSRPNCWSNCLIDVDFGLAGIAASHQREPTAPN